MQLGFAVLSAACACAYGLPGSAQFLFGLALRDARNPGLASAAVHLSFLAAALLFGLAALTAAKLVELAPRALAGCASLTAAQFWGFVLAAAAGLRLAIALVPTTPMSSDDAWYHATAVALSEGRGLSVEGSLTAYRPPGYPWLLSLLYRCFGPHPALAWIWGALATVLMLIATYGIAQKLYGERVARISTLGLAIYPATAMWTGQPMSDLVFCAGLVGLLWVVLVHPPQGTISASAVGLALGLLGLVRSIGPVFLLAIGFVLQAAPMKRARFVRQLAVLVAAMALPLLLWTVRNERVFGYATLGTNAGLNFFLGNHHGASGGYLSEGSFDYLVIPSSYNQAEADHLLASEAVKFIREQPLEFLSLLPRKLIHLFAFELSAAQCLFALGGAPSWVKYGAYAASQLAYAVLLGLFGWRVARFRERENRPARLQWLGFVVLGLVCLVTLMTFGMDRYRLPFLPWMMIEAAVLMAGPGAERP